MTSLTPEWAIAVPEPMNRRIENDQMVWRPGLTAWISVWGDEDAEPPAAVLDRIKQTASPTAYDREGDLTSAEYLGQSRRGTGDVG